MHGDDILKIRYEGTRIDCSSIEREYGTEILDESQRNWYNGSMYRDKQIMKFRASSLLRVHGYRKGDRFRVLRFEIDHKQSDHG